MPAAALALVGLNSGNDVAPGLVAAWGGQVYHHPLAARRRLHALDTPDSILPCSPRFALVIPRAVVRKVVPIYQQDTPRHYDRDEGQGVGGHRLVSGSLLGGLL